ncbi:hypothetical protein [Phenylobacterium sp. J367]|uniref:hypothetical protein n=1 Tax=Phenylobacterium sp. J367 TaxID=2898435 RepID=UPI002151022B|nr:hypothetical protein [Phenylobacterium sp. J367]MCR5881258.1 hypothetical protein [Phenylobacterium sp. J367]
MSVELHRLKGVIGRIKAAVAAELILPQPSPVRVCALTDRERLIAARLEHLRRLSQTVQR